jgi:hypothetical protein
MYAVSIVLQMFPRMSDAAAFLQTTDTHVTVDDVATTDSDSGGVSGDCIVMHLLRDLEEMRRVNVIASATGITSSFLPCLYFPGFSGSFCSLCQLIISLGFKPRVLSPYANIHDALLVDVTVLTASGQDNTAATSLHICDVLMIVFVFVMHYRYSSWQVCWKRQGQDRCRPSGQRGGSSASGHYPTHGHEYS